MSKLRIDYSIECDECNQKETADLTVSSTAEAREDFLESGWIVRGEDQLCPACAEDES